jgi:hypothetical protein
MASPWTLLLESLGERLDEDLLPAIYAAASVPTEEVRRAFRDANVAHVDPVAGLAPPLSDVEESARRIVRESRDRAALLGVASGFMGAAAVPPEVLASLVHTLRLGQRLAVVFGFDPETDAGKLVLWRAIAAAYEVELPTQGAVGLRMRELPDLLRSQLPATRQATGWLARQVVVRTASSVAGRITRLIPGLGAGLGGLGARRRMHTMGHRMIVVYRQACDAAPFELEGEELAVEVKERL